MVWIGGCGLKQNLGGIKPIAPCNARPLLVVPDLLGLLFTRNVFWLGLELFSSAISIALTCPVSSVRGAMKRERNGNQ